MPEESIGAAFGLQITAVRPETEEVKSLLLRRSDGGALGFEAGQFVTLHLQVQGRPLRRSYSLSGVPGEPLTITLKRYPNGTASRWLFDHSAVGDVLTADGPHGLFTRGRLPAATRQLFLYAAGVGITPVFALLKDVLLHSSLPVTLLYSNRSPEEAVFYRELQALEAAHPDRLRIRWFFSNDRRLLQARLGHSTLPSVLADELRVPLPETAHYLCGPLSYQFSLRSALTSLGLSADRIRTENFDPAPPAPAPDLPDMQPRELELRLRGASRRLRVEPPLSILQSARAAGIALPYSCESGRCGACAVRCAAGAVWMSNNEVLTDADLEAGLVLTCTAHPVGDGVVLTLD